MVIPVGTGSQSLTLIKRDADGITTERLIGVMFVPMTGEAHQNGSKSRK
jgi:protein-L-isoaspartate O-methyltransferase